MSDLRERLEDLVADVPATVVPDIGAARAAGDRRRRTRRGVGVAAAAVVALLGGFAATGLMMPSVPQLADGPESVSVSGYPERVTAPWWIQALPDQAEPLAGLFQADGDAWFALGEHGEVYRLGFIDIGYGNYPSISPDGTKIAYVNREWQVAIRDVVTGKVITFPSVSGGKEIPGASLFWTSQAPAAWSPDSSHLLVQVGSLGRGKPRYGNVVLSVDGTIAPSEQEGNPAGWLDADRAVVFDPFDGTATTIGRDGQLLDTVELEDLGRRRSYNQFSPVLSTDARTLSVTTIGDTTHRATTDYWNMATGQKTAGSVQTVGIDTWCPSSRTPDTITLSSGGYETLTVATVGSSRALVMFDPGMEPTCAVLADHALAGGATGSPIDRLLSGVRLGPLHTPDLRDSWIVWHLRYVGVGLVVLLILAGTRALRRRTEHGRITRGKQ